MKADYTHKDSLTITNKMKEENPLKGVFAQVNDDMLLRDCGAMRAEIENYKNQQEEFIKWLENKIERKRLNATCTTEYNDDVVPLMKILQKYKEIIGYDKE